MQNFLIFLPKNSLFKRQNNLSRIFPKFFPKYRLISDQRSVLWQKNGSYLIQIGRSKQITLIFRSQCSIKIRYSNGRIFKDGDWMLLFQSSFILGHKNRYSHRNVGFIFRFWDFRTSAVWRRPLLGSIKCFWLGIVTPGTPMTKDSCFLFNLSILVGSL